MNNHIHLIGECVKKDDVSNYMRIVNSIFSRTMNKRLKRCGQFIMDRFKSPTIQSYNILFKVMQYVDLNPFRAKIVKHPKNYRWSSFAYYAYGKSDPLITPSPSYLSLSNNDFDRQRIYLNMIESILVVENKTGTNIKYSKVMFIGDPEWVKEKYAEIKLIKTNRLNHFRECLAICST